jgi:hypothetical protein
MKKYLATVFAFLFLFGATGGNSSPAYPDLSNSVYAENIQIQDTWNGVIFEHEWRACDAVASITVEGAYDVQKFPGGISIAMGMTWQPQHVQINVDGLHQHCQ